MPMMKITSQPKVSSRRSRKSPGDAWNDEDKSSQLTGSLWRIAAEFMEDLIQFKNDIRNLRQSRPVSFKSLGKDEP
jgi:hypothetical protein